MQLLVELAAANPRLATIDLETVLRFIRFALLAQSTIYFWTVDAQEPPALPPLFIQILLAQCVGIDVETVKVLWHAFKNVIWTTTSWGTPSAEEISVYNKYALPLGTCGYSSFL